MDKDFDKVFDERQDLYASLKSQYNPEGSRLRNYQNHLTNVLVEFDEFCKSNGVRYYLAYGTLLGAVRHHGFIPWDDDADLWIDRENYEKLTTLMKGEHHQLSENVYITMGIRPELWAPPFAYIDIFIIDNCPNNPIKSWIKQHAAEIINMVLKCRVRIDTKVFSKPKAWFVFMPIAILGTKTYWQRALERVSKWFVGNDSPTEKVSVYNECVSQIYHKYPASAWEVDYLLFEGHQLPVPKGFDVILTEKYGDYMTLPNTIHEHGIVNEVKCDF